MTDVTGADNPIERLEQNSQPFRPRRRLTAAERQNVNAERVRQARQREGMESAELVGSRAEMLDKNRRLLEVDWNNQTDWLLMNDYVKQLITLRPSVLEGQRITLDPETILDYALYGTPRSPGVMMSGASEYFIFDDKLQRYVNTSLATEAQMQEFGSKLFGRRPNGQMVEFSGTSEPQIPEFEPLADSMLGTAARGIAAAAGAVGAVVAAPVTGIASRWQGPTTPVLGITDIEGFPSQPLPNGKINFAAIDSWLAENVNRLDTAEIQAVARFLAVQKNQMIDPFVTERPAEVGQIEQIEQRLLRRERVITATEEGVAAGTLEPAGQISAVSQQRAALDQARAQFERSQRRSENIAEMLRPNKRWESAGFTAVPLGFEASEFVETVVMTPARQRVMDLKVAVEASNGDQETISRLSTELTQANADLMLEQQETMLQFAPGSAIPYSARDRLLQQQSESWRNTPIGEIPQDQRQTMEGRGRALQASAYRSMLTEVAGPQDLLTEQGMLSMLRGISQNPADMVRLKQRLAFVYGGEDRYTSDTAIDDQTIASFAKLVGEANRSGKKPMPYLMSLMNDPTVKERAAERGRGTGSAFTIRLPAVEDIQTVVQDVARKRLGMRLDDTAAANIAQSYLGTVEQQMRSQAGSSTIREPMAAETFAEQQIGEDFGAEVDVYAMGTVLDSFTRLLGGRQQ